MTKRDDGGPAFPLVIEEEGCIAQFHKGMTMRAYAAINLRVPDSGLPWLDDMIRQRQRDDFAGQALAGLCADPSNHELYADKHEAAANAYLIADAMLAARKGGAE